MAVFVFDMDGVIIDSEMLYLEREKEFFRYKGMDYDDNVMLKTVGSNGKDCFKLYKEEIKGFNYNSLEELRKEKREYFKDRIIDYRNLVDKNIYNVLKELKKRGHSISLASSSSKNNINQVLGELQITDYFDHIISGEDFVHSKPDPEIYLYVKKLYNDDNFYAIEDSTIGIMAAKKANMKVIGKKDNRFGFDQSSADYLIDDLNEIIDIADEKI